MAERPKLSQAPTTELKSWLDSVAAYEKTFKPWDARVKAIIKRYRDERSDESRSLNDSTRFNILWSNVQTLKHATFAKLPKPDVSRRFRDNDPVGRVASLILERALDYEVQHYTDYRATLDACVLDRFLGGRGTAWVRYEPKFRAQAIGQPQGGLQSTEDVEPESTEVLDYECAPCDYVDWRDFGHSVARTWEEVPRVWRRVYMKKAALEERFGEDIVKTVPMDASALKDASGEKISEEEDRACIYEGWDKATKKAVWFSKGYKDFLDERDDPLGLEGFFPCPTPMFSTLTNDTLVPIPDFALYQDQAVSLDILAERIDGLVKALMVRGVYDASIPELARLFTEAGNGELKPVKNWAAFAEKQGLRGAIDIVDLAPIGGALVQAYQAFEQIKNQIYEITRISDIMRGFVDPEEKLGQSQLKTQYSNLGIKAYQDQVAEFAAGLLRIKAEIMCNKFEPQTLIRLSAADQLSENDKKLVGLAMQLLLGERAVNPEAQAPNPLRSFRVEVASDSMIQMDEEQEKTSRMEFLQAQAQFVKEFVAPVLQSPPQIMAILAPVMMEQWKFGTTAFKVGKGIEGSFDEAAEKLKQLAAQPQQPQIPPEMMQQMQEQAMQQAKGQVAQENAQKDIAFNAKSAKNDLDFASRSADLDVREMKFKAAQDIAVERTKAKAVEVETTHREIDTEAVNQVKELLRSYQEKVGALVKTEVGKSEERENIGQAVSKVEELNAQVLAQIGNVLKVLSAPKRVVRDAEGRAVGLEPILEQSGTR